MYNEDGSVAAGKGEVKIAWDPSKPIKVGYYYYGEDPSQVEIYRKEFPMDKDCVEKVFDSTGCSRGTTPGTFWVEVVPGTRYAMQYADHGHAVAVPGARPLELPSKIYAHHAKDADKFVADRKKDTEKEKEHPYQKEGGDAVAKADLEAIKDLKSCSDISDNLGNWKKACVTLEDLPPYNQIIPTIGDRTEFGWFDEKEGKLVRQAGLADKAKIKAEEVANGKGAEIPHKVLSTAQKVFKGVIEKAIEEAAKKAGPDHKELVPDIADRIDTMDGCVPGVARLEAAVVAADALKKDVIGEEYDYEKDDKEDWAKDKDRIAEFKAEDEKDYRSEAEAFLKEMYDASNEVDPNSVANSKTVVNVEYRGYVGEAFVTGVNGDKVNVTWPANLLQASSNGEVPAKAKYYTYGTVSAEDQPNFYSLPPTGEKFLDAGRWVRVRDGDSFYEGWVTDIEGDKVHIEDSLKQPRVATKADVRVIPNYEAVARRGIALLPNFASLEFWWIAAEDPNITVRKLRIWRLGAREETLQTVDLQPRKGPKKVKEGEPAGEVHIGYSGTVQILDGRYYGYNFLIGDATFVDYETKATSEKACKIFSTNLRVEY